MTPHDSPTAQIRCGRIMVGSGPDTYDPTCDLIPSHAGTCKSFDAIDQHRLPLATIPRKTPGTGGTHGTDRS